jgi:hypothetical protein
MAPLEPADFVPPLPDGVVEEWRGTLPLGEGPHSVIPYWLFVMRVESSRMLWLALDSWDGLHFYVYDRIEMPALPLDEVFIPFMCTRYGEYDIYLAAIARRPEPGLIGEPSQVWRIDPGTNTIQAIPAIGVECGCW